MRRTKRKSNLKETLVEYINTNARTYIIVIIMFLIGLVLAIISINNIDSEKQNQISAYINNFITGIKSDYEISKTDIITESIKNNFYITLTMWFLGSTIIGMPLIFIVIIYKGYSVGYTLSSVIAALGVGKGSIFIIATLLIQYIVYIPCILSMGVSGIKLYKLIVEERRRDNIKIQILRHTIICLLLFAVMGITSILESNFSAWSVKIIANYI